MTLRRLVALGALAALALSAPQEAGAASRPPVVMIVFDEFPGDSLLGPDGRIDRGRFPNFARLAGDSTWYPNATTVADWTFSAVPSILDASWPQKNERVAARERKRNLFRLLARRGYGLHSTEEVTKICFRRGCRRVLGEQKFLDLIGNGRFERLRQTIRSIHPTRRPRFTFHHTELPHIPWVYLPSGRRHQAGLGDLPLGFTGPPSFLHPFLTLHAEQRYLLQLGAVDRALGELIDRLRSTRLYREALVVVTADHGIAFEAGLSDRRLVTRRILDRIAPVPLIIKSPGQRRGRVDRAYVRSVDIVPTIARILRIRVPWHVDGRPASSRTVRRRRHVKMVLREFRGYVSMGAAEFERGRAAHTAERLRNFGSGSSPRLYRIGPHQELLGRSISELAVTIRGDVRAEISEPARYGAVDPGSGLVPASVIGTLHGGGSGDERDLAVAVNSRIAAVGHSAAVVGERFAMMFPESSLRPGRNAIELFEVRGGLTGLSLVPLGRAP